MENTIKTSTRQFLKETEEEKHIAREEQNKHQINVVQWAEACYLPSAMFAANVTLTFFPICRPVWLNWVSHLLLVTSNYVACLNFQPRGWAAARPPSRATGNWSQPCPGCLQQTAGNKGLTPEFKDLRLRIFGRRLFCADSYESSRLCRHLYQSWPSLKYLRTMTNVSPHIALIKHTLVLTSWAARLAVSHHGWPWGWLPSNQETIRTEGRHAHACFKPE